MRNGCCFNIIAEGWHLVQIASGKGAWQGQLTSTVYLGSSKSEEAGTAELLESFNFFSQE